MNQLTENLDSDFADGLMYPATFYRSLLRIALDHGASKARINRDHVLVTMPDGGVWAGRSAVKLAYFLGY